MVLRTGSPRPSMRLPGSGYQGAATRERLPGKGGRQRRGAGVGPVARLAQRRELFELQPVPRRGLRPAGEVEALPPRPPLRVLDLVGVAAYGGAGRDVG